MPDEQMSIEEIAQRLGTDVDSARTVLEYWQGDVSYELSIDLSFATLVSFPRHLAERIIAKHMRSLSGERPRPVVEDELQGGESAPEATRKR